MIGPGVHFHGGNHVMNKVGVYMDQIVKEEKSDGSINIGDDVWIGANCIILKGVTIGEGSVIGAGSIVLNDVEPYSIVAGNPARKVKDRFSDSELLRHLSIIKRN